MKKLQCVYILASRSRILYVGIKSNLLGTVRQHRKGLVPGFTRRYRVHRLVHFEASSHSKAAIAREKKVKRWRSGKEIALIEERNPNWMDLAGELFAEYERKADPSPTKTVSSG
jgi:putative endonuclease